MSKLSELIQTLKNLVNIDRTVNYPYRYGFGWIPKNFGWMGKGIEEQQFFKSPHAAKAEKFEGTLSGLMTELSVAEPEDVGAIKKIGGELTDAVTKYAAAVGEGSEYFSSLKDFFMGELKREQEGKSTAFSLESSMDKLAMAVVAQAVKIDSQLLSAAVDKAAVVDKAKEQDSQSLQRTLAEGGVASIIDQAFVDGLLAEAKRMEKQASDAVKPAEDIKAKLSSSSPSSTTQASASSSPKASDGNPSPSRPTAGGKDKEAEGASQSQGERSPSPKTT